jgi:hypothetical protein
MIIPSEYGYDRILTTVLQKNPDQIEIEESKRIGHFQCFIFIFYEGRAHGFGRPVVVIHLVEQGSTAIKPEQRENVEERAEMGQPEGTGITSFLIVT